VWVEVVFVLQSFSLYSTCFHRLQTLRENEYCYMQATDYFVYSSVTLQTFKFMLYVNLVILLWEKLAFERLLKSCIIWNYLAVPQEFKPHDSK
jgi:hypothetical protein